VRPRCGSPESS